MNKSIVDSNFVLLDRYYMIKTLGKGGYGQVIQAYDMVEKVEVAVKVSHNKYNVKERNIIEAKLLEKINAYNSIYAKHVVKMKCWHDLGDCVVMVMELLSQTLKQSIADDEFNTFCKISVCAQQMVEFLILMQRMNIIHGDIKPQNILVEKKTGKLKFADFSLGYWMRFPPEYKRRSIQTLFYRAPEVIMGYDYNLAVDIWSSGCVLVECLVKIPLFVVTGELELMQRIVEIIGTPDQEVIKQAPNRDAFFEFHQASNQWIVKGTNGPLTPIGLKGIIKPQCEVDLKNNDFNDFVDLIENMMRVDPFRRYSPDDCAEHKFIELANYF